MQVSLDEKDIEKASRRGLDWLSSKTETPNEWNEDLVVLKYLFSGLISGSYKIVPNKPQDQEETKPIKEGTEI